MNIETRVFLRKRFKAYYWKAKVTSPAEVHKREFGVGTLEDKIKVRHKSFASDRDLSNFLKREAPSYISYSTAYYEFPENQPMEAKNWLGADLVFDLDAPLEYLDSKILNRVKAETINLKGFLLDDFGISESDIAINFSGSKGYHLHVSSDEVLPLSGEARRQVVDYVTGSGLDLNFYMREIQADGVTSSRTGEYINPASTVKGPTGADEGWGKRIYDTVHEYLEGSTLKDFLRLDGVGPKRAENLLRDRKANLKALESGSWEGVSDLSPKLLQKIVDEKAVALTGDTDKMVTIDTARLIRLPDTIHGGSGLLAKRVGNIEEFDPLVDAVVFGKDEVKITSTKDMPKFDLMDEKFGPYKLDESMSLPEYAAVYLMLKDAAEKA
ncbi:MAG: DNA primase catalytic subunit PriS [Methanobacteriota archaeon]